MDAITRLKREVSDLEASADNLIEKAKALTAEAQMYVDLAQSKRAELTAEEVRVEADDAAAQAVIKKYCPGL